MIDHKYFESSEIRNEYKKQIESVCKDNHFDAAIVITEPFYIADALSYANIDAAKYTIMMDPYTNNPSASAQNKKKRLSKELHVFNTCQKVFTLYFVGNDMDYLPQNLADKRVNFCIPKVERLSETTQKQGNIYPSIDTGIDNQDILIPDAELPQTDTINFVYVGQLYEDIRNPERMLELFTRLPDNYILHLYGGGCENIVSRYKETLGNRLICHGWVSSADSARAQKEANVLINLNNSMCLP